MKRLTENKIVLVKRRTRLEELIQRFNTEAQARFYIEHLGADFSDYKRENTTYHASLAETREALSRAGRLQELDRSFVPNFIFGPEDTVVVLGQDGLVANVLKYLDGQPVVGVNPDPERWEGVLLPFGVTNLLDAMMQVIRGRVPIREVTMAKATLSNGETLHGVNDLFIGQRTHTSARYHIAIGGREENHSSSGIIVSTGLGSTGWMRSVLAGATGVVEQAEKRETSHQIQMTVPWDAARLHFSVREPWPSKTSQAGITFGIITQRNPLVLTSQMPEKGVIFSDGIETDFLEFNSGLTATITIAEKRGRVAWQGG